MEKIRVLTGKEKKEDDDGANVKKNAIKQQKYIHKIKYYYIV